MVAAPRIRDRVFSTAAFWLGEMISLRCPLSGTLRFRTIFRGSPHARDPVLLHHFWLCQHFRGPDGDECPPHQRRAWPILDPRLSKVIEHFSEGRVPRAPCRARPGLARGGVEAPALCRGAAAGDCHIGFT